METQRCPLCDIEKDIDKFKDKKLYHKHQVCMDCCTKASQRIEMLTEFDVKLCEDLDLDYALLNSYKGKLFDDQFT